MPMYLKSFRKWIRQIYVTRDEELDCDGFLEAVPRYVDMEVAGEEASQRLPDVKHHLGQCEECYDLYLTLRDIALLESQQIASELANIQRSP
jgi:predicted anti-sigma-YlaC factor YlaD